MSQMTRPQLSPFAGIVDGPIQFKPGQHTTMGDALILTTPSGVASPGEYVLKTVAGVGLTVGKIVGLAGDFYTVPGNNAISGNYGKPRPSLETQKKGARSAADELAKNSGGYLKVLDNLRKREEKALGAALRQGMSPAVAYHTRANGLPTDLDYDVSTLGYYARISWYNFDHFGNDARAAYIACHAAALDLAAAGNGTEEALKEAYFMDSWGLHFLSDIFSSGNLRVPRRALHDNDSVTAFSGGAVKIPVWDQQARFARDEDSACGLLVQNDEGSEWIAYGDKEYFSGHGRINRLRCEQAGQASVDEIYTAFTSGSAPPVESYAAMRLSPKPQEATASGTSKGWSYDNFPPLWISTPMRPDNFLCRRNVNDHSEFTWEAAYPGYEVRQWPPGASKKAKSVKTSDFRMSGLYPNTKPIEVSSGGFIQIQQFPGETPLSNVSSANVFGPISVALPDGSNTFSLRTRTRNLATVNHRTLAWSSYSNRRNGKTSVVRFTHSGSPSDALTISAWSFHSDPTMQVVDFTDLETTPLKLTQEFSLLPLAPEFSGPGLSSARFFIAPFTSSEPDIIAVTFPAPLLHPRVTIHNKLDFLDSTSASEVIWSHIKLLSLPHSNRLLVAASVPWARNLDLVLRDYVFSSSSNSLVVNQTTITLDGAAGQQTHLLIGDVLATGSDQLVVTTGERTQIYTIASLNGKLSYTLAETAATGSLGSGKDHILTAVAGRNILTISKSSAGPKKHPDPSPMLEFVLSEKGGPGVVSLVEDQLSADPNFRSIAWHRAGQEGAIQVFAWYGMLGARVFERNEKNGGYAVTGVCMSLGQPAGRADEIVQWGAGERWEDVEVYNPRPEM